ncbi:hypothetical protein JNUCC0626_48565 [Lentzea sp. JNUCC 0626]|uniref:hypothetical protein n=1 Tax=Lentzea sp. JNUCC 0626 TaxID=3367513 RepID=UPI003748F8B4
MATSEEILSRVSEFDSERSDRRKAAAHQVGDLARRHADLVAESEAVQRELAEILAGCDDVISLTELAQFTDVPEGQLAHWRDGAKPGRGRKRRTGPRTPATKERVQRNTPSRHTPHEPVLQELPVAQGFVDEQVPAGVS